MTCMVDRFPVLYPVFSTAYNKIEAALSKYETAEAKGSSITGKNEAVADLRGDTKKAI